MLQWSTPIPIPTTGHPEVPENMTLTIRASVAAAVVVGAIAASAGVTYLDCQKPHFCDGELPCSDCGSQA